MNSYIAPKSLGSFNIKKTQLFCVIKDLIKTKHRIFDS